MAGAKVAIDNISQEYEINLSEYFAQNNGKNQVLDNYKKITKLMDKIC